MMTKLKDIFARVKAKLEDWYYSKKLWVLADKKRTTFAKILGYAAPVVIIVVGVLIVSLVNAANLRKCGYQDILDQLENGTYTAPTTGEFTVNEAGWIVNLQQVDKAEDPIKNLAKADREHNILLFIGYKVDTTENNIIYAFVATEENGSKYTVYSTQNINRKFTFEKLDYSEIEKVFFLDTTDEEIDNVIDNAVNAIDTAIDSAIEDAVSETTSTPENISSESNVTESSTSENIVTETETLDTSIPEDTTSEE